MFDEKQLKELRKDLDKKHVKGRKQAGTTLSYIESWHAIREANRIFGEGNWSRELRDLDLVVPPQERQGGTILVAYVATVRIHIHDGEKSLFRDGTGYGSGISKSVGDAFEGAAKEAESDAMKRALMTFGYPFGLALYDKTQEHVSTSVDIEKKEPPKKESPKKESPPPTPRWAASLKKTAQAQMDIEQVRKDIESILASGDKEWTDLLDNFAILLGDRYYHAGAPTNFPEFCGMIDKVKKELGDDPWYYDLCKSFKMKNRSDASNNPRKMTLFICMIQSEILNRKS